MVDELDIETKFFANRGVIGRRDFALNFVILGIIVFALAMPINYHIASNIFNMNNILKINVVFFQSPLWMIALYMLSAAFLIVIGISNVKRRITDICGRENDVLKYIFSSIIILNSIGLCFGLIEISIISFLYIGILLFLVCKKGKITSKLPDDVTKLFNFGAFFGGWIWGLINKVYYPLWQFLLFFTPFSFQFSLICGLKGNEWALKAKKYDDIEKFNSKQETQGIIFSIIFLFVLPTLIMVLYIALIFLLVTSFNSEKAQKAFRNLQTYYMESTFEKCEFKKSKNVCYVKNDVWKNSNYEDKINMMKIAAQSAADEKNAKLTLDNQEYRTYKTDELKITKIYTQDGRQLVAEFDFDDEVFKSDDFKKVLSASMKAYKFYPISK
ncbi:MAG: hypothetical protein IJB79_02240 [Candidatus Gastranaerophilales bacterium]|nr:hypothetical protein [Candidatus Gastranaerophilales bacterium]